MRAKLKKLRDQVIVITGASSGIGLTTAEMAAAAGARVVLNSRDEADLRDVVERIRSRGGHAAYHVGDVADPDAMEDLANRAVHEFGGFDTWVNNAGVSAYGLSWQVPLADKRRIFDVNFWGVVHGCRAAVRHLRTRSGAIVNVGSVASDVALPLQVMYSASKHAVQGYTDGLRMELEREHIPIALSLVKPSSIDTPYLEHARNYMDREPELPPPVYAPEEVAHAILRCAEHATREIVVGGGGRLLTMMESIAPRLTDRYMETVAFRQQQGPGPKHMGDSLNQPQGGGRRHGPTRHHAFRSAYTRAALSDVGRALPVIALGAMAALAATRRRAS